MGMAAASSHPCDRYCLQYRGRLW